MRHLRRRATATPDADRARFFDAGNDLFCIVGTDGRLRLVNDAWERVLGWTREELLREPLWHWAHPDDAATAEARIRATPQPGARTSNVEDRYRCKDGSERTILWSAYSENGREWFAAGKDVTDLRRADAERERSAGFYAALVDALHDPMAVLDDEGRIVEVNRRFTEVTGWPAEEIVGTCPPHPIWPDEEHDVLAAQFADARRRGGGHYRAVLERRDGERFPALLDVSSVDLPGGGRPARFIVVLRDVSREEEDHARLLEAHQVAKLTSWEWDPRTRAMRLFGTTALPFQAGTTPEDVFAQIPASHRDRVRAEIYALAQHGGSTDLEHPLDLPGGGRGWFASHVSAVPVAGHRLHALRGTSQDITDRHEAERESRFRARLLDEIDVAVVVEGLDGVVRFWNRAAEALYGYSRGEAVGRRLGELIVPDTDQALAESVAARRQIVRTGRWDGTFDLRRRDGSVLTAYVQEFLVRDDDGKPEEIIGVSVDMTERVAFQLELERTSERLVAIADNMGEGLFAMDNQGRLTYVNRAAERLLGVAAGALVGKLARDVIHIHADQEEVDNCPIVVAQREGRTIHVEDDAFLRGDGSALPVEYTAAPFRTEHGVEGAVVVFEDITRRKSEQERLHRELEALTWAGRVREALDEQRFLLHAQPIVDLATGSVVQNELLIRMQDEDGSLIPPGEFLPVAERSGLITQIDRWVIRQGLAIAADGTDVQINLSARSVGDPKLAAYVASELAASGADPSRIVFELTETALLEDEPTGTATVRQLAALGCRIALDDFGTGYGGFRYLKQLPVDLLKIDMEFVRDLTGDPASRKVVASVVALAAAFGQRTVAEGIEDEATVAALRELGVDYGQGFLYGRPAALPDAPVSPDAPLAPC